VHDLGLLAARLNLPHHLLVFSSASNGSQSAASPDATSNTATPDSPTGSPDVGGVLVLLGIVYFVLAVHAYLPISSFCGWFCGWFPCLDFHPTSSDRERSVPSFVNMDMLGSRAGAVMPPISNVGDDNRGRPSSELQPTGGGSDRLFPFPLRFGRDGEPEIRHLSM
jgi:hypothetical protein